jgi:hypothetical protein
MWETTFRELRALTNSKDFDLSPMELNNVYGHLEEFGSKLEGDDLLSVLDERPWPVVKPGDANCRRMYGRLPNGRQLPVKSVAQNAKRSSMMCSGFLERACTNLSPARWAIV